jgi:hypothetical protein
MEYPMAEFFTVLSPAHSEFVAIVSRLVEKD